MNRGATHAGTSAVQATDVLGEALTAIDAIVADAQQQQRQGEKQSTDTPLAEAQRRRGGGVFAVMAEPHFRALQTIVLLYGVQLMPSLDALMRRVLVCVTSPSLVSSDCWEFAAMLGTYFRAGATRLLEEVMALMLTERSMFLLGSPCIAMGVTGNPCSITDTSGTAGDHDGPQGSTTLRNLCAFEDLLLALGPFVPSSTMQRVALRYAQEVVVDGVLNAKGQTGSSGEAQPNGQEGRHRAETQKELVETALMPQCLNLLTTLLKLCRPLPSDAAACAVRAVKELPMRSFLRYGGTEHHQLLRSVMRLSVTLTVLRHPYALPFYVPPRDIVERPTRHVVVEEQSDMRSDIEPTEVRWGAGAPPVVSAQDPISGDGASEGGGEQESTNRIEAACQSPLAAKSKEATVPQVEQYPSVPAAGKHPSNGTQLLYVSREQGLKEQPVAPQARCASTGDVEGDDDSMEIPEIDIAD